MFLKTARNSRARTNENSILTPSAMNVINTPFSGSDQTPRKKIISETNAVRVKPPASMTELTGLITEGRIM
ncbi:MAG: hypothetical protein U5L72_00530 [Bacteroidales bacterium]|nr:hypothetical protein [Bacteroidales bacterium]